MSGLVNGLQNRLQQFESARHLKKRRDCIMTLMQSLLVLLTTACVLRHVKFANAARLVFNRHFSSSKVRL